MLALCAIFRNEAPYLREWVEFHRIVGVERFYLYQNRSNDDWLAVLQPYITEGVVEVIDWPKEPPCHLQAYQHFIEGHKGNPRWVAFLDCDEFLFSPCYETVPEILYQIAPHWGAVGVNWLCFGASGHEQPTPAPVIERFTFRPADGFGPNVHVKSIVRMDRAISVGPNPHFFNVHGGTCSESGEQVRGALTSHASHRLLRINHYHTKSRPEYIRRIALGKADGAPPRSPMEFDHYQAMEIDDRAVWRFLPLLKSRLASLST